MVAFPPWSELTARDVLSRLPADERLILPALQVVQSTFGHVAVSAVAVVADVLNVSRADVHGVLTFYDDLRTEAPAAVSLAVCTAEACQANGARELMAHVTTQVAPVGRRSADGAVEVSEVFCLGNCALGPTVRVDDRLIGRATPHSVEQALANARATS